MIADIVWQALGATEIRHYIEPFFGSGAVLLARPNYDPKENTESVCDKDGHLANVWRALQFNPDDVAKWCDWPVNHADLSARKKRLIENENRLLENLIADETWYDAKLAGYWIWAASCWIGSGLTRPNAIPHLSGAGKGVQEPYNINIYKWFRQLSERLRYVRVVCGDWKRVCGGNWQDKMGLCGMFFDPPYAVSDRDTAVYHQDSTSVAKDVRKWILERGNNKNYRIVYAGYDVEGAELEAAGWSVHKWKAGGGYSSTSRNGNHTQGKANSKRERIWFSPYCHAIKKQQELFK